jgi:hypothetical protein
VLCATLRHSKKWSIGGNALSVNNIDIHQEEATENGALNNILYTTVVKRPGKKKKKKEKKKRTLQGKDLRRYE